MASARDDRPRSSGGFGLIEVVIAVALFMVVVTPVAYLLSTSGGVTGAERAKALATDLAHQAAATQAAPVGSVVPAAPVESVVSGIRFTTTTTDQTVCRSVGTGHTPELVPMVEETVTVTWGTARTGSSVQLVRWLGAPPGATCP